MMKSRKRIQENSSKKTRTRTPITKSKKESAVLREEELVVRPRKFLFQYLGCWSA